MGIEFAYIQDSSVLYKVVPCRSYSCDWEDYLHEMMAGTFDNVY